MPRFYGLRLSLGSHHPSGTATSSSTSRSKTANSAIPKSPAQVVEQGGLSSRGVSVRDRDMEDECFAEDFKRPRAEASPPRQTPVGGLGDVGSNATRNLTSEKLCAGSTCCASPSASRRGTESIYSLASPWLPSKEAVTQLTPAYSPGGGRGDSSGRVLCFDGEGDFEEEQVGWGNGREAGLLGLT